MSDYKAWCKATNREDSEPRYSANWLASKRAWFKVFDDRIECGSWEIPKKSIHKAIVYKTKQMFIPVTVLQLITEDGSYQFGFNPWTKPAEHLGIEVEEQFITLKYSFFSLFIRVAALAYVGYWIWLEFSTF